MNYDEGSEIVLTEIIDKWQEYFEMCPEHGWFQVAVSLAGQLYAERSKTDYYKKVADASNRAK